MRIVIVNTAASSGGALSILKDFYEYIKENEKNHEWIFILSDNYIEETENIKVIINKDVKSSWRKRLSWEFFKGSKFINNLKPDVVFSMQNTISIGINSKKIIYLHQPVPFQDKKKFSFLKKEERILAIYQYIIGFIIKKSINRADKIIVQTKWMRNALVDKMKILSKNVKVIHPTILNIDRKVKNDYLTDIKFFYPASGELYKNHKCIIEATKILLEQGIKDFNVELTLEKEYIDKLEITQELQKVIKLVGKLSREEVFNRYSESVLVFPSYIETFGLPMLEASQIGGIILASDCEFSKEILESYNNKYYFDPFKPNELAELMKQVINKTINLVENDTNVEINNESSWSNVVNELYELGGED